MDRLHLVMVIVGTLAAMVAIEIAVLIGSYLRNPRRRKRLPSERAVMRRLNGSRFWFRRITAVNDSDELKPSQRREAYSQVLIQSRIDERTAIAAAMGISELAAPATARLVLHAVDEGRLPAFAAAAALAQSIPVDEGNLAALLMSGELGPKAKQVAVATLGERGGAPSVKALVVLLTVERDTPMRLTVTRALLGCVVRGGELPPQVCPRLLADSSPDIRSYSTLLAGAALGDDAAPFLFPMLVDASTTVAQSAARAICDLPSGLSMVTRFLVVGEDIEPPVVGIARRKRPQTAAEIAHEALAAPTAAGKVRGLRRALATIIHPPNPNVTARHDDRWELPSTSTPAEPELDFEQIPALMTHEDAWERARSFLIAELSLRAPEAHWQSREEGSQAAEPSSAEGSPIETSKAQIMEPLAA